MGLTTGLANLVSVGRLPDLRIGAPALRHLSRNGDLWSLVPESDLPQEGIRALSLPTGSTVVPKGALEDSTLEVNLEHVGQWGRVSGAAEVSDIGSSKLLFGDADLLTAKLRPYLGKTILNSFEGALGTTEWIPIRVDSTRMRPKLLFYLMQTSRYTDIASALMTGKEHPRISPDTLFRIRVPLLDPNEQDRLVAELDTLDARAKAFEDQLGAPQVLVSQLFESRFGLSFAALEATKDTRVSSITLADCAGNRDARFSFRFHSPSGKFASSELSKATTKRLADFLSEPIVLGASVSPDDYEEGTGKLYASMAAIKSWSLDVDAAKEVSTNYFEANSAKKIAVGDVLMARSGEGTIGKVALVGAGIEGIASDFTMRIRVDRERLLPSFLAYCLMSEYYQHLVYKEKKGLGNNTNIFPNQLRQFPILDVSLDAQQEVVDELDAQISAFESKRKEIDLIREQMENTLLSRLRGSARTV